MVGWANIYNKEGKRKHFHVKYLPYFNFVTIRLYLNINKH